MKDCIQLAQNDNFRHIICYLANSPGMKIRAARMVMDVLNLDAREASGWVNDVSNKWRGKDPDGNQVKPLPKSFQEILKG